VVANRNGPPSLLVNQKSYANHWIEIQAVGTRSNRSGIGARVSVKTDLRQQVDEVRSGSSYISNSDTRVHFGLGAGSQIQHIEVRWPSGLVERFRNVPVDSIITLTEGLGQEGGQQKRVCPRRIRIESVGQPREELPWRR
jgi:enediyne biosynthesis protein E4